MAILNQVELKVKNIKHVIPVEIGRILAPLFRLMGEEGMRLTVYIIIRLPNRF